MSDYAFNYSFNITGDASTVAQQITGDVVTLNNTVKQASGVWDSFSGKVVAFNQLSQFVEGFSHTVESTLAPGAALNASLADLSAVSGETGESLRTIERYARDTAKTFGGSAAQSVESYKLLLSQLSPELAKTPAALKNMGDNIAVLSKTMGGDATAAAEVLTTAMNQYGVSLADPMEASRKMTNMMNVMAAAGQAGSAELPTIKVALEQCGMAAKAAGVSFEETNAAIQVLDKAGKKGAEGGVALRNVMAILSTGRFLPKDVQDELTAAGVNVNDLTDKSKSLTERLEPLKSVLTDSALFTKMFGRENTNAAMALVQGIDEVNRYTEVISGTNTAFDQAGIIMESYNEKKARVQARFEDFRISVFNATGDFGIWVETIANALVPISQLTPLVMGLGKAISLLKASKAFAVFKTAAVSACRAVGVAIMNIPIIGWVAAAVAGLIALGVYFWNTSAKFRAVLKGLGAAFVATFKGIWDLAKNVFGSIGDLIKAAFRLDRSGIREAIDRFKGGFADFGSSVGKAFDEAYEGEMARSKAEQEARKKKEDEETETDDPVVVIPKNKGGGSISTGLAGIGSTPDKADKIKNIHVTIEKLIDKFEIRTTNLHEDMSKVKEMVAEALTGAVNDVNYAI